jgi:hypothetical protein
MPSHSKVGMVLVAFAGVSVVVNAAPIVQKPVMSGVSSVLPLNDRLRLVEAYGDYHGE